MHYGARGVLVLGNSSTPQPGTADCVLLSGATGFVGMEILSHYLERTDRQICTLVRAKDERDAERRIRSALSLLFGDEDAYPGRITAVPGDIQIPMLGLDRGHLEWLAASVTDVIHCAASPAQSNKRFTPPTPPASFLGSAGARASAQRPKRY